MNCKYCGAEIPENSKFCLSCGKATDDSAVEAAEKKSVKMVSLRLVLAIVAVVVLAAALVTVLLLSSADNGTKPTTPTVTEAPATIPSDGNPDNETCKGSYTVTNDALVSQLNTVVATMGDVKLNNGMLQVYYWNQVYDFLNYVGGYAAYFGLDYTKPLDTQIYEETKTTWQQYFLKEALNSWHQFAALAETAKAQNVQLPADMQKALDEFETNLETEAKEKKYASAAAYLEEVVGPGVTVENYKEFLRQNYLAFTYLEQMAENKDVTTDEINAYYAEHEKDYKTQKESKSLVYHVRHILLFPGGTEKKEYTEADWTKGLADAEAMLQQWRDGEATEESFAELAKKHSGDSNAADGGLYEALTSGTNFVKEFKDWYMDENRQVGDTGIVKTTYGYHLMYFSGMEEEWVYNIRNQILKDYQDELVKLSVDKHPAQITYSNVVLGTLNLK